MQYRQPIGNIELILIIQVIFSVHEIFPLRLRLFSWSGVMCKFGMGMLQVQLLPPVVFTAALDLRDDRVKSNGLVTGGVAEAERGAELEAALAVVGGVVLRGI